MADIEKIDPVISAESEQWEETAEGLLTTLFYAMRNGEIKPKEMIICFFDRKDGKKRLTMSSVGTKQKEKLIGMLELCKTSLINEVQDGK